MNDRLTDSQLAVLATAMHAGSADVSQAMESWLHTDSLVEVDSVEQLPFEGALEILGANQYCCFTSVAITGAIEGHFILGFDDKSGLALCDLILERDLGTAYEWGEVEISAALETMNIIGSIYLNSLSKSLAGNAADKLSLLPSPPVFLRDFAESLLQTAIVDQAVSSDWILVAQTKFTISGRSLDWTLLFIPDGPSLEKLAEFTCG